VAGVDAEVVIVGAGPVGLVAAYRLNRFGISTIVIESNAALPRDLRASTFHPPTLDMLAQYGLAAPLIAQGRICPTWQIRIHETGERAVFDLAVLNGETDHPYRLQCEQFRLCHVLEGALADAEHVDLRLGTELIGFEQDESGVTVRARGAGGEESIRCNILVGADGARSRVREQLDLAFEGVTYPETTILATTTFPFEDHIPDLANVTYFWSKDGTFSLLRLPSIWRCSIYPDAGESIEEATRPEVVRAKMQRIAPAAADSDLLEIRPYRVHMRIVDNYRRGRVVLAGDAAHVNSPSGGMGMNGGIHDAYSLTETLRQILGGGSLDLLDRYTRQRRPIAAQEVLAQADRNRARMQERDPAKRRAMLRELQDQMNDPVRAKAYLMRSSMIDGLRRSHMLT